MARHPGPEVVFIGVEVLNVGGWLTDGDFAIDAAVAIDRTVLNRDESGGTSLHPMVWSNAAHPKRRRVDQAVRNVAWLPGPASLWTSDWYR